MAILSDGNYLTPCAGASDLTHLDDYFWPLAFAGMVSDGRPRRRRTAGTTTLRIARQLRLAPPQPRAHKQRASHRHDQQSCNLLPVHTGEDNRNHRTGQTAIDDQAPKAPLKTGAVQTLRDIRSASNHAKRLDCGGFSTAFGTPTDRPPPGANLEAQTAQA